MNAHPLETFAPLTDNELRSGTALHTDADEWKRVSPVPADAPPQQRHTKFRIPNYTGTYHNATRAVLFYVWRFETDAGKKIRPLSLWRSTDGRLEWRWKANSEPRPHYNLDMIAADPDAPIVLVEGERTADAAALIFPSLS
jgi:putative DNA primase/helicase